MIVQIRILHIIELDEFAEIYLIILCLGQFLIEEQQSDVSHGQ